MKQNPGKQRFITVISMIIAIFVLFDPVMAAKTVKDELDAAKKDKKTVFLVLTGNGVNSGNSMKIAQQAQKKMKGSVVILLNRDDKNNTETVKKLGLISTPIPFILVVGMNGLAAGGFQERDASADKLVQLAPSVKKAEALTYIDQKKPVFIIAYKKSFKDRVKVVENCKSAISSMNGNAAYVEVDLDDPREKTFLDQVGGNPGAKATQILVFNSKGKNTGNFDGVTDPNKLKAAALTVPKTGGCCPSGSGAGCGKK